MLGMTSWDNAARQDEIKQAMNAIIRVTLENTASPIDAFPIMLASAMAMAATQDERAEKLNPDNNQRAMRVLGRAMEYAQSQIAFELMDGSDDADRSA